MKRNYVSRAALILLFSTLAKALSFFVRIYIARFLPLHAMKSYTLLLPTIVMFITLVQCSIPLAISKLIAEKGKSYIRLSLAFSSFLTVFCCLLLFLFSPILSSLNHFTSSERFLYYSILPLLPFVSLTGNLKGYFYGIQKPVIPTIAQIMEEVGRILFLYIFRLFHPTLSPSVLCFIAIFSMSIAELCSFIFMLPFFLKTKPFTTNCNIKKADFYALCHLCFPMTGSKLLGSLVYFLEPIIMLYGLSNLQKQTLLFTYSHLHGYVLPILTMPSFLTIALSNDLLPSFTANYHQQNYAKAMKIMIFSLGLCFLIGSSIGILCYMLPDFIFKLCYHSTEGVQLLKKLALPFILYSLQAPLSALMHGLSLSNYALVDTCVGSLLRLWLIVTYASKFPADCLPIALTLGMLVTTILHAYHVSKRILKFQDYR